MCRFSRARARMRPWIAVAASYAIVLQLVLAAIAVGLAAAEYSSADGDFIICSASSGGQAGNGHGAPPSRPSHDAACALLCSMAAASPTLPATTTAHHFIPSAHVAHAAPAPAATAFPRRFTPRQSQGPPPAA